MAFILRSSDDEFEKYRKKRDKERTHENISVPESVKAPTGNTEKAVMAGMQMELKQVGPIRSLIGKVFGLVGALSFISVFILAFLAMPWLEDNSLEWVLMAVFGLTFFSIGLAIWAGGAGKLPLVFTLVGGVILGVSLLYGLGAEDMRDLLVDKGIPCLAGAAFLAVGTGMMTIPGRIYKSRKATYTEIVTARVVDKWKEEHRDSDGHSHTSWHLAWRYMYHDKEYSYRSPIGRRPENREPGHIGQLYVDPVHPGSVWEGQEKGVVAILGFMGVIFLFSGVMVIVMMCFLG